MICDIGYDFDGTLIGLAWVGGMCGSYSACIVQQSHGEETNYWGGTMAHEIVWFDSLSTPSIDCF
jgi:hypothetical protein